MKKRKQVTTQQTLMQTERQIEGTCVVYQL